MKAIRGGKLKETSVNGGRVGIPGSKSTASASTLTVSTKKILSDSSSSVSSEIGSVLPNDGHADQHPALKSVCVVNCDNVSRIIPNSSPAKLENECFEGTVMLLMRTPDVDDPKDSPVTMGEIPRRISKYMTGKARRFEFQFQIKLKKVPTGPLFLGCELEQQIKVSRWTKGLVGVLLSMIGRINSGFHYSWGADPSMERTDPEAYNEGHYEKTHLSFPVEASMDRIVITKPGETPPQLGHELHETNESVRRRRKMGAGCVDWNLEDTYTMCLWSAYCDWISWKSLNVPGMRPFSLSTVTGKQPIYLSVYEISNISPQEYRKQRPCHYKCDMNIYTRLEFSNCNNTEGGLVDKLPSEISWCEMDNSFKTTRTRSESQFMKITSPRLRSPRIRRLASGVVHPTTSSVSLGM